MRIQKRLSALLAAMFLCCAMAMSVCAHEIPDMSRYGSVTAAMKYNGEAVGGGTLTLYRVGDVSENDGNYSFTLTDSFAGSDLSLDNISDAALAADLAKYASANNLAGTTADIGQDGAVTISGLNLGLYLVVQQKASDGYEAIAPFLVSVPMNENGTYLYDVNVEPKMGVLTKTPAAATEEPSTSVPGKESKASESTETTSSTPAKGSSGSSSTSKSTLPQTGQLNWPVPVLAVLGMGLILMGRTLRSGGQRRLHEA